MTTEIKNTRGNTVLTIQDRDLDITTPLTIVGRKYPKYGSIVFSDLYSLMENFAAPAAPEAPVEGMNWFNTYSKELSYFDGSSWKALLSRGNSMSGRLTTMSGATNLDMTNTGQTSIYTGGTGTKTVISGVLIIPRAGATNTSDLLFSLEIETGSDDVMDRIIVNDLEDDTSYGFFNISGVNRMVEAGDVVKINIIQGATGTLNADIYLFGHVMGV